MTSSETMDGQDSGLVDLSTVEICTVQALPPELQGEALVLAIEERPDNILMTNDAPGLAMAGAGIAAPGMAVFAKKLWKPGRTLRVRFMDNAPAVVRENIEQYAREWEAHANIRFDFGNHPDAEIRITCTLGKGSWSYLGADALTVHKSKPTMNYGWFTSATPETEFSRTVLHEFGHALGCVHEHMHPLGGIPWNRDAAYRYYMQTQGWTKQQVDSQLFAKYSMSELNMAEFDPTSIMHYPVPRELTTNGFSVGWNTVLSERDKTFIRAQYPGVGGGIEPMADLAPQGFSPPSVGPTEAELRQLFNDNTRQLDRMNLAAAALVKGLIMELKRPGRATYIRLRNPAAGGHTIEYEFVAGDRALVRQIADALGFKSVTDSRLEVHGA